MKGSKKSLSLRQIELSKSLSSIFFFCFFIRFKKKIRNLLWEIADVKRVITLHSSLFTQIYGSGS